MSKSSKCTTKEITATIEIPCWKFTEKLAFPRVQGFVVVVCLSSCLGRGNYSRMGQGVFTDSFCERTISGCIRTGQNAVSRWPVYLAVWRNVFNNSSRIRVRTNTHHGTAFDSSNSAKNSFPTSTDWGFLAAWRRVILPTKIQLQSLLRILLVLGSMSSGRDSSRVEIPKRLPVSSLLQRPTSMEKKPQRIHRKPKLPQLALKLPRKLSRRFSRSSTRIHSRGIFALNSLNLNQKS